MTGQIFANEMKCYFNLRKPKECRPTNINMVTSINHKQVKLATGVKIYPNQWNMKKQEAYISIRLTELDNINNTVVNNKIRELKDCFVEFKEYLCDHPDEIENSVSLLKRYIYKDKMKKYMRRLLVQFVDYSDELFEHTKKGIETPPVKVEDEW